MSRLLRNAAVSTTIVLAVVAIGCSGDALTAPEATPEAQFGHKPVDCEIVIRLGEGREVVKLSTPGHACDHADPGPP